MKILNFQQYTTKVFCDFDCFFSHSFTWRWSMALMRMYRQAHTHIRHFIHQWILSEHLFNAHTFCCDRICLFRFSNSLLLKLSIRCYDHYNSISGIVDFAHYRRHLLSSSSSSMLQLCIALRNSNQYTKQKKKNKRKPTIISISWYIHFWF